MHLHCPTVPASAPLRQSASVFSAFPQRQSLGEAAQPAGGLPLRMPPSNRLEALRGKLRGFYSIRVNDRWRIIFRFEDGNAFDVRFIDYH